MRNLWTIASREYRHYFATPIAYVVALLILATVGILFVLILWSTNQQAMYGATPPEVGAIVSPMAFLFLFAAPALTMRLLADEQRTGTMELLLTAPVRDWELVVGKWLGSFLFLLTIIGVTLIFPLVLNRMVTPGIDQGILITSYLGIILVAASFLAIGTAFSSFFSNQVGAFIATLVALVFFWWIVGWPAQVMPIGGEIFRYLELSSRFYNNFLGGVLNLSDIIYYLSITALGLFLGTIAVEMRRWQ